MPPSNPPGRDHAAKLENSSQWCAASRVWGRFFSRGRWFPSCRSVIHRWELLRGSWFFGFTHCKAVCPRALQKLSETLGCLAELAGRIAPLYVTVDPDRDTPQVMKEFLRAYPNFIGLRRGIPRPMKTPESIPGIRAPQSGYRRWAGVMSAVIQ
ncbi:SCO family protein [Nocardia vinacea]|uniref:SCO family protein n=1 Tax=Nocardia vinacea TaxID=96468 RepID=UPI00341B7D12